jgi:hypothetical protein
MARQFERFTVRADGLSGKKAFEYEATILGMLHAFEATRAGHALLNAFRFYRREVLIYPYDGNSGTCNATEAEDWGMFRTKISFSPRDWIGASACHSLGAGSRANEVLYHEMVHAMRSNAKTMGHLSDAGEETVAVMLSNVYSSEIHRPIRATHDDFSATIVSQEDYLAANRSLIETFYRQHKDFCRWVAEVVVPWNPIRVFYRSLTGVPRLRTAP